MWELIKNVIFQIFNFFYFLVGDWGLAIVVFTIIFRVCLSPLIYKQTKSSYLMKKMQPEINRIKELYAHDKQRQAHEMQNVYKETKFNPITGCVPLIIQMPIFFALFQVLSAIDQYVADTDILCFYEILPDLTASPRYMVENFGVANAFPYVIILVIFACATFVPMLFQQRVGTMGSKKQMYITAAMMSIMMLWFGWGSPGGVLLYWGTSSLLGILQQRFSMRIMVKKDAIDEAKKPIKFKPVQVNVVRKEKKKRPTKKK